MQYRLEQLNTARWTEISYSNVVKSNQRPKPVMPTSAEGPPAAKAGTTSTQTNDKDLLIDALSSLVLDLVGALAHHKDIMAPIEDRHNAVLGLLEARKRPPNVAASTGGHQQASASSNTQQQQSTSGRQQASASNNTQQQQSTGGRRQASASNNTQQNSPFNAILQTLAKIDLRMDRHEQLISRLTVQLSTYSNQGGLNSNDCDMDHASTHSNASDQHALTQTDASNDKNT